MEKDLIELIAIRALLHEKKEEYEASIADSLNREHELKNKILEKMKKSGELSKRYEHGTLVRQVKKTPKVVDETKVIHYLHIHGLDHEYVKPRLTDEFDGFLKQVTKEGKAVDGIEIQETEFLSIRKNDAKIPSKN